MNWLSRLLIRWFDRHDPALRTTGVRVLYTGYDYAKAQAASQRSKQRSDTGRKYPGKPAKAKARVVPIRKKVGA